MILNKIRYYKAAFSLIELAIVLVIIGLVIASVSAGVELVRQAQVRKVIKDLNDISTSIYNFKLKFDFLPGDFPQAGSIWSSVANCPNTPAGSGCNGNGNGFIESNEQYRTWQHLSLANMVQGTYTGTGSSYRAGVNALALPAPNAVYVIRGLYANLYTTLPGRNIINLAPDNNSTQIGALNSEDSYAVDVKIDDGLPARGRFLAGRGSLTVTCTSAHISNSSPAIRYLFDTPNQTCTIWYILD